VIDAEAEKRARSAEVVRAAWSGAIAPDPALHVWEWAERCRELSAKAAGEPGPYRIDRVPYTREIQEVLSDRSPVREVVVIKGAQLGFSEVGNNLIGYTIDHAPAPTLLVLPTLEVAQRYSRQRLAPMIADSPTLRAKVRDPRSRDASNSTLVKEFPGGFIMLAGANSPASLRSIPARKVIFDELDAFPPEAGEEGDPVWLAERAALTFGGRRKNLKISTPTIEGRSRIVAEFETTDQRFYFVPCPRCGDESPLAFSPGSTWIPEARKFMEWDEGKPETARVKCQACNGTILEHEKQYLLANGHWLARRPELSGERRGYAISSLYSPLGWTSWGEIVKGFLQTRHDQTKLRVWVNQRLGEPWRERGDAPEWQNLYNRRAKYAIGTVPRGGLVLTCGVDIQADRIELEVKAWGAGLQNWSIDYRVIPGTPREPAVWRELERVLAWTYRHEDGADLSIRAMAIDTGFATADVYAWVRRQPRHRVFAIKGREGAAVLVSQPQAVEVSSSTGKKLRRGIALYNVGVDEIKSQIYGWLRMPQPTDPDKEGFPPGWVHFPEYGEEWFRQLCAEQVVVRIVRGYRRYVWEKVRERNEALDCFVYSRAAAAIIGLDRWGDEHWSQAAAALGSTAPTPRPADPQARAPTPRAGEPGPAPARGRWLGGRGGSGWLRRR